MPPTASDDAVSDPAVYDHLRLTDDDRDLQPGVYRVVGTTGSDLTLLRVGDADGRRVNTGDVVTVDRADLGGFEPTDNPDGNRSIGETVSNFLADFGWQARAFVRNLAARPLASLVAVALVVVGQQGGQFLSAPGAWLTAVYFLGVAALVYLGSRG